MFALENRSRVHDGYRQRQHEPLWRLGKGPVWRRWLDVSPRNERLLLAGSVDAACPLWGWEQSLDTFHTKVGFGPLVTD